MHDYCRPRVGQTKRFVEAGCNVSSLELLPFADSDANAVPEGIAQQIAEVPTMSFHHTIDTSGFSTDARQRMYS
mgnify:CR=1 FL=1